MSQERKLIDDLLEYAVKYAEMNDEPSDGECWSVIERARRYFSGNKERAELKFVVTNNDNAQCAQEDMLALATTALRDLYMGYPPREIAALSGTGLGELLKELVEFQRAKGVDDEGGWDCDVTDSIPIQKTTSFSM